MLLLKQSSTTQPLLFLLVNATDHISPLTGVSPTVTLSKNGGAFGAPAGAVSEIANGWYKVAGNTTDSGTLGPLVLHATATGSDPTDVMFEVVAFDPQDPMRIGLVALPAFAAESAGGLYTRGTGTGQINQDANGRIDVNAAGWAGGTLPVIPGVPGYKKNVGAGLVFAMVDPTGVPVTGLVDATFSTKQVALDAVAPTALTGSISEVGLGFYLVTLTAAETNGNTLSFAFNATGAIPLRFVIQTNE
jgi:hypothetical protein